MVGRPTSGRCDTCRKRKIKCDKIEPACGQCLKAGWKCPGYKTEYEFRHETSSSSSGESSCGELSRSKPVVDSKDKLAIQPFRPQQQRVRWSLSSGFPSWNSADRLRWEFCSSLRTDTFPASLGFVPSHPYLELIPLRLGYDQALDDAVACIVAFGNRPPLNEDKLSLANHHVPRYTRALQRLRIALDSIDKGGMKPTTLAAMLMLHMFENYFSPNEGMPRVHSDGLEATFLKLGPQRLNDNLSCSILNASLGNIFFKAMLNGEDCFLAQPQWVRLLQNHQSESPAIQLTRDMTIAAAPFPGLLKRFNEYRSREDDVHFGKTYPHKSEVDVGISRDLIRKQLVQDLGQFQVPLRSWIFEDLNHRVNQHDASGSSSFGESPRSKEILVLSLAVRSVAKMFLLFSHYMLLHVMPSTSTPIQLGQLVEILKHPLQEGNVPSEVLPQSNDMMMLTMDLQSDLTRLDSCSAQHSATVRGTSDLIYLKLS